MRVVIDTNVLVSGLLSPFTKDAVDALLDQIVSSGEAVASVPLRSALPDRDDEPLLEVALAGRAEARITGNSKHYPREAREGAVVLSPAEFVEYYRTKPRSSG